MFARWWQEYLVQNAVCCVVGPIRGDLTCLSRWTMPSKDIDWNDLRYVLALGPSDIPTVMFYDIGLAARPRVPRRRARAASVVVMLVVILMSVGMFVPVVPAPAVVVAILVALAIFPTLPLYFAFVRMILIVTLIFGIVFSRSHEVYRPIAGIVLLTVLAPIPCVIRRDVQIDGRRRGVLWLDHHWLCVDDRRRTSVADIDLTIHPGDDLPGQHDADVQSACMTCADAGDQ